MKVPNKYRPQVQLLVRVLPHIAKEESLALKGGTALNLFIRDLPRLSVDIDLVYLPVEDRQASLAKIDRCFENIISSIQNNIQDVYLVKSADNRIIVRQGNTQIKIEISPVLRGSVYPAKLMEITDQAEEQFGYAEIQVLSFNDLYGGKICAALDRQHPRDLFDIKLLLENEGISRELFETFLVYLISHNRPIVELLDPVLSDLNDIFENEFVTMTESEIALEELEETRAKLVKIIHSSLTEQDKEFLISFKKRKPDWSLFELENISELPAVKWKLVNLDSMDDKKHQTAVKKLEEFLQS